LRNAGFGLPYTIGKLFRKLPFFSVLSFGQRQRLPVVHQQLRAAVYNRLVPKPGFPEWRID
jgi:hypothetical protein